MLHHPSTTMERALSPPSADPVRTELIVEVTRSGFVESLHRGAVAVVDADGRAIAHAGDPARPVFWRSAAKLHQLLPLIVLGGLERWRFSPEELAVMCGSHNGEPAQIQCVESILARIGRSRDDLRCGAHEPYGKSAAAELIKRGDHPNPLHNTCSGNHAGLLALAELLGADARYEPAQHPAQRQALAAITAFSGVDERSIALGVDGCGIPAYRTTLHALACAFARLFDPPAHLEPRWRRAAARIVDVVTAQPDFISGRGELDTELIRAFGGAAVCKLGAEAVCAAAFSPSPTFPRGVGIALKIEDGVGNRARAVALAECVRQLQLGTTAQRTAFDRHVERTVFTRRGEPVGEVRAAFQLSFLT